MRRTDTRHVSRRVSNKRRSQQVIDASAAHWKSALREGAAAFTMH
jgi:hypothetical protein